MKTHWRMIAAAAAVTFSVSLMAGCGSDVKKAEETPASATAEKSTLKNVTLKFFIPGDEKSAKKEVMENLSALTREKLNASFEFNFVGFGDYQNKLTMLAASGDTYDACFTADWFGYATMVNKGAYLGLNELMSKYAPDLLKVYQEQNMVAPCSVNGQLMALPWTELKTSKPVFNWRQDIADKLGVQPGDVSTIEGIDAFLTKIAAAKPGIVPFDMAINGTDFKGDILSLLAPKYEYQDLLFHSLFIDLNDPKHKVFALEQSPIFLEAVKYAKKWYDAGVISRNALTDKENSRFESGKVFSGKTTCGALYEDTAFVEKTAVKKAAEVYPDKKFVRDSPLNNAMAINKNAANPERTLMFFNLITTDQKAYDALLYGIKDKTYSLDDKGVVGYVQGDDPGKAKWLNWMGWGFERVSFVRPTVTRTTDAIQKEQAFAKRANVILAPLGGFNPVPDTIKSELATRDQLFEEQGKLLLAGLIKGDAEKAVSEYVEKQKAAGLDKILAEVQKQVDALPKN